MISDIVCEYMVKRKPDVLQLAKAAGAAVAGVILSWLLGYVGVLAMDRTGLMVGLFFFGGLALTIYLVRFLLIIEYEYTFVNGELTIDRISARSRRKKMTEINVKTVEKMGVYDAQTVNSLRASAVKDYSASLDHPDTLFLFCKDEKQSGHTLIFFTPNQKVLDAMRPYVSATVYREAMKQIEKQKAAQNSSSREDKTAASNED